LGLTVEDVSDSQVVEVISSINFSTLDDSILLMVSYSCLQLRNVLLDCIQVSLAGGKLEDLAELFQIDGVEINPKLKQLLGQVK
jgi:hypothetical protein